MTDGFAVPIGTNGAETTYLLNQPLTTTITTTVNGGASTTTQTTSASHTLIVSASGYKLNGVEGIAGKMDLECRSTGKDVGECLIAGGTGTEAQTATVSVPWPPNDALVVPVSATGGAVGLSTGKHLMLTVGALVLGALAIF
ncbi:hypothetical protein PQX77_012031 [Marasmius sp. AFHP31]|nr:hypothetical protein PQX77_012031 [Marasmius sp. AFHP31]